MNKLFLIFLSVTSICFTISCSDNDDSSTSDTEDDEVIDENYDTNSQDIDVDNAVTINFGSALTVDNQFENAGVSVTRTDGDIVIRSTITDTEVNYVLSGQTLAGSVKIYSDYKFGLILNGVSIVSNDKAAINIQSSKKVTVTLVDATNNRLIDGTAYTLTDSEDMKGALFSEGQLIFGGNGNLKVKSRYSHAISSDDYIRINEGNITISGSVKDGIHANDYFRMDGGILNITSTSDAIECEKGYIQINGGTLSVKSTNGDGLKTSYSGTDTTILPYINIAGGTLDITVTGEGGKGVKSKGDAKFSGGNLTITTSGNAYYDTDDADISSSSGIKTDGNLVISDNCVINVTSSGSAGKGISVDGNLVFNGGTTTVTTSGGIFKYGNDDSAAKAIKSDGDLTVNSGTIKITTSKEEAEGLESKKTLTINDGTIEIEAYDDCINASTHIAINGGNIYCLSSVNDAIDSNGTLTITGGTVVACGAGSPEAGFDCDNNTFKITGGTLVGVGGSTSTPTSSVSTQRSLIYNASSYQIVYIESASGTEILTFKLPKSYSNITLLFSSPSMASNTSHTIYTGGSISGGTNFHGLYSGATYTKGSSASTFTTTSMVTSVGTSSGGGRP